jgi:hypothetical protein
MAGSGSKRGDYETLKRAVLRAIGGKGALRDLSEHGADTGWPGLTYYSDTVPFFERHKDAIFELLAQDADDQGVTIPALIASFRIADSIGDYDTFANALAWYAAEAVAFREVRD